MDTEPRGAPARRRAWLGLVIFLGLVPAGAQAHPSGAHKRVRIVVHADRVEALVTLDVDAGRHAERLRARADVDRSGTLGPAEFERLKERLVGSVRGPLKLRLAGHPLTLSVLESKLDLRGDPRALDGGLSLAVLLQGRLPGPIVGGMQLEVADEAPDRSHVLIEAEQVLGQGAGPYERKELSPGDRLTLRLVAEG
jgi:hypothetical protein